MKSGVCSDEILGPTFRKKNMKRQILVVLTVAAAGYCKIRITD